MTHNEETLPVPELEGFITTHVLSRSAVFCRVIAAGSPPFCRVIAAGSRVRLARAAEWRAAAADRGMSAPATAADSTVRESSEAPSVCDAFVWIGVTLGRITILLIENLRGRVI